MSDNYSHDIDATSSQEFLPERKYEASDIAALLVRAGEAGMDYVSSIRNFAHESRLPRICVTLWWSNSDDNTFSTDEVVEAVAKGDMSAEHLPVLRKIICRPEKFGALYDEIESIVIAKETDNRAKNGEVM